MAGALLAAPATALAQNTYSGYFLDGYTYGYQMNPAFGNDKNYVGMPVLGNINTAIRGNLHLSNLIHVVDGKTVLFTNPMVSESVLDDFGDKNKLATYNKFNILSGGFKAFGGYNTISISGVANIETCIPGSFFRLAKEGITNRTYDITDMSARAAVYGEIALNHSRDIKQVPGLRVGAAIKFLIGVGGFEAKFNDAQLTLGEDAWIARTNADIYASVTGLRFETDTYEPSHNQGKPYDYVSGANLDDGFGLNGFGMAFDLGAEYKWRDFNFSLAVIDLGFMNWGKTQRAGTNGTREVITDAYTFNLDDDASNSFDNEFDRMSDDLSKLYNMEELPEMSSRSQALAATLNIGVDYEFPFYRKLHFGLLNSTRIAGAYTWTQFRLSANVAPVKIFSATANIAMGTYGFDFGWMINLHTRGINLFLGMDHTLGKLAKQGIPLNSNASFNFGLNFPF